MCGRCLISAQTNLRTFVLFLVLKEWLNRSHQFRNSVGASCLCKSYQWPQLWIVALDVFNFRKLNKCRMICGYVVFGKCRFSWNMPVIGQWMEPMFSLLYFFNMCHSRSVWLFICITIKFFSTSACLNWVELTSQRALRDVKINSFFFLEYALFFLFFLR